MKVSKLKDFRYQTYRDPEDNCPKLEVVDKVFSNTILIQKQEPPYSSLYLSKDDLPGLVKIFERILLQDPDREDLRIYHPSEGPECR